MIINQPFNGQLGEILIKKLKSKYYSTFTIFSAFAKNSGVLRLSAALNYFRKQGGKVVAFIGIDAHGTSYEAVKNLFHVVDALYIVHDTNPTVTFHSKIYYLSSDSCGDFLAIGSNNLTAGGLWTNYESTHIFIPSAEENKEIKELFEIYKEADCPISSKIESEQDIDEMQKSGLLRLEVGFHMDFNNSYLSANQKTPNTLFGTNGNVKLPKIKREAKGVKIPSKGREITAIETICESNTIEKMWFETRAMTGGSRNILDLSMLGQLVSGSPTGTKYETTDEKEILGDVVFFDIDPTNATTTKDITLNYKAIDYIGCTIKYAPDNGSWRIQLKGQSVQGERLAQAENNNWMVNKIIILEKIRTDYYSMSVVDSSEIDDLIMHSIFVAKNGSSASAKRYGLLNTSEMIL